MDDAKLGIFFIIGKSIVLCYVILVLIVSNDTKSSMIYVRPRNGQYLLPKVFLTYFLSHYSVCQKEVSLKIIYKKFITLLIVKYF